MILQVRPVLTETAPPLSDAESRWLADIKNDETPKYPDRLDDELSLKTSRNPNIIPALLDVAQELNESFQNFFRLNAAVICQHVLRTVPPDSKYVGEARAILSTSMLELPSQVSNVLLITNHLNTDSERQAIFKLAAHDLLKGSGGPAPLRRYVTEGSSRGYVLDLEGG